MPEFDQMIDEKQLVKINLNLKLEMFRGQSLKIVSQYVFAWWRHTAIEWSTTNNNGRPKVLESFPHLP